MAGAGMADVTEAAAAAVQGDRSRSGGRARRSMWRALGDLWVPLDRAWTVYALFLLVFLVGRCFTLVSHSVAALLCGIIYHIHIQNVRNSWAQQRLTEVDRNAKS